MLFNPLFAASATHSSLYPFPSKRIFLLSLTYFRMTSIIASSCFSPLAIWASTSALNFTNWSPTIVLSTIMEGPQFAADPTARNSNLFPVKAKGEVLFRSVLSSKISGICPIPNSITPLFPLPDLSFFPGFSISSSILNNWLPIKMEIIAGGASFAPKRWSFPAEAIAARNKSACWQTAWIVFTKKTKNWRFSWGLIPGESKFLPLSVLRDQLLCLPEPFTRAKGFSWNNTFKSWRPAIFSITSISNWLWSTATLASSNKGAHSNWPGATSLCRVFNGMPNFHASISKSAIKANTRSGIAPK